MWSPSLSVPTPSWPAGQPVEAEECNWDPTSQAECDGLTLQTTAVGSKTAVTPNADGSLTMIMDLWVLPTGNPSTTPDVGDPHNTNPNGFDDASTVFCDATDPCSIWIGDDPSNWAANSFVFNGLTLLAGPAALPPNAEGTTTTTGTTTTASGTTTTSANTTTTATPVTTSSLTLAGGGSSFAGVEMDQWTDDVSSLSPPVNISYNPTSSGDGRTWFRNETSAYAVSDIAYQGESSADPTPAFSFEYIPIVAGSLGFMYNLPGNPVLRLSAGTACGIFTGEITRWDDPALATLNPGVDLPNLAITPVLRADLSGTNFVLEQWCIAEAPQVWASFASYVSSHSSQFANSDTPPIGPTTPSSAFPVLSNGEQTANGDSGTAAVVGSADGSGDITYVEPEYAKEYNNKPVAFVENASGDFVQPTPENVAGALAYAQGQSNGIQVLNFGGQGCNVYNPSTYSYMLARTDGSYGQPYGQVLGGFLNYVLTIGEKQAAAIDYSTIGLSLEQFGISQAQKLPGYPALNATERANFAAGDVTPSIVQDTPCGSAFQLGVPSSTSTTPTSAGTMTSTTTATTTTTSFFSTASGVIEGEGGQYDQPWWDAIRASAPPSYGPDPVQFLSSPDMDQAREDLVTGTADFAVAEGPLDRLLGPTLGQRDRRQ